MRGPLLIPPPAGTKATHIPPLASASSTAAGPGARPQAIGLTLLSLAVGLSLGFSGGEGSCSFSPAVTDQGQLGEESVGGAVSLRTTAIEQKKRGKDELPFLEPEFISSPAFPRQEAPDSIPSSPVQMAVQRPNQQSWTMVDAIQARSRGQGACFGQVTGKLGKRQGAKGCDVARKRHRS